jgi:hypothetical protein
MSAVAIRRVWAAAVGGDAIRVSGALLYCRFTARGGDEAALYFDPRDEEELAKRLVEVGDALMEQLKRTGKIQVEKFSFSRCAKQTTAVLNAAMAEVHGA